MPANTTSRYDPSYCELVVELLKDGSSFARFRAEVGIGKSTFYYWRDNHPEFEEACEVASAHSVLWWEARAKEASEKTGSKGQGAVILAGLYNRGTGDWSNKHEVETKVVRDVELDLKDLTDEELEAYERVVAARKRLAGGAE